MTPRQLFQQALDSKYGVIIKIKDVQRTKQTLYRARRALSDYRLDSLKFRTSPVNPDNEIWIMKISDQSDQNEIPNAEEK